MEHLSLRGYVAHHGTKAVMQQAARQCLCDTGNFLFYLRKQNPARVFLPDKTACPDATNLSAAILQIPACINKIAHTVHYRPRITLYKRRTEAITKLSKLSCLPFVPARSALPVVHPPSLCARLWIFQDVFV